MRRTLLLVLLAAVLPSAGLPAAASAKLVLAPVGASPLGDAAAAGRVKRSDWEPRPENEAANHRVPTAEEIAYFRASSDMPNKDRVTGRHTGTTDEILQWGARKWGFHPDLFRAMATVESWWRMSTVGDSGDSLGLTQIRRPYHCCHPLAGESTAFNVDYYGGILRAY